MTERPEPAVTLADVAVIQSGITKGRPGAAEVREMRYMSTANVQALRLDLGTVKTIAATEQQAARHRLQHEDVLILEGGDADKVGRGWLWESQIPDCLHQNHVFAVRPNHDLLRPRYLAYYVNAPQARTYFLSCAKQTTNLASINKKNLSALPIPLPSLDEQDEIVAALDRRLTTLDAAESRVGNAISRLNDFVGSSLNELVDSAAGCADQHLEDLAERVTSGSRDWKPYYGKGTGVFVLTQNVRMRRLDLTEPFNVDPPSDDPARARSAIKRDDILVTIVGANCGNLARVPTPLDEHFVCQSLALIRLTNPALSEWIELYLAAPAGGQAQFAERFYGQGRPHLSFADLKTTHVKVPNEHVRERAIARFRSRARAADGLAENLRVAAARVQALRAAVLRDAFALPPSPQVGEEIDSNKDHAVLVAG
jgi:hypothetical protein